ncbi:MAG: hypothetical protein CMC08_01970 [Flavobacteriaceae bacterium]|nr:hypothetical protein [Flavobacteriaceae bacterium]
MFFVAPPKKNQKKRPFSQEFARFATGSKTSRAHSALYFEAFLRLFLEKGTFGYVEITWALTPLWSPQGDNFILSSQRKNHRDSPLEGGWGVLLRI